jgi:hypothetical protein
LPPLPAPAAISWADRGEITLEAAAKLIGVCNMTALRMLRRGDIKGRQACAGAPWVIRADDLAGFAKGKRQRPPLTQNTTQRVFDWFLIQLYRWFPSILQVLTIVRPETLVHWHRAGFRCYWRWKSRAQGGRPQIDTELRVLIRRMSVENPLWGAPRIHGELLKLG